MKEQFVPYNIALRMKELGFDEECLGWSFGNGDELHLEYIVRQAPPFMCRPLYQQAFDWVRNNYQIHGQISILTTGRWHYTLRKESNNWDIEFPSRERYDTYEEARLNCLNYLLNLI